MNHLTYTAMMLVGAAAWMTTMRTINGRWFWEMFHVERPKLRGCLGRWLSHDHQ